MNGSMDMDARITAAVEAIEPDKLQPIIRRVTDDLYENLLMTVQDCLRENADFNLKSHLEMLERENARMRRELWDIDHLMSGNWLTHETRMESLRSAKGAFMRGEIG